MANREIKFEYDGLEYSLGFSRRTIRMMDSNQFTLDKMAEYPNTYMPMLFEGAFLLHHRKEKSEKIREIYKHIEDKQGLITELAKIYDEATATLMEEPEEGDPKKVSWKAE